MALADYGYDLPAAAIAQRPVEPRDHARLLVAAGGAVGHHTVRDLPDLLRDGDVLVVNETRVLPARIRAHKETGGAVEVLLLEPWHADPSWWEALVRPGRRVHEGMVLTAAGRPVVHVGAAVADDGRRLVRVEADALEEVGEVPLPPYIHEALDDPERYQTVYARTPGSVAAPTAGLHLTDEVLRRCRDRGVTIATVDLMVGLGTFKPIETDDVEAHRMHEERYAVPAATIEACAAARRVVAVGTTTVRALESAARGQLEGRTDLFITPGFDFRVVDVLMTNFHVPRSSLLVLLAAFYGPRWRALYECALEAGYRFLSFGDAMLVERDGSGAPAR